MGHLLQGTAFLRWSVLRFRHCDGQFRYMTLPRSAFPVLLERVVGRPKFGSGKNGCAAARAVFFEPLGKERGGGVDGFRRFTSRGSQFHQVACVFEGDGSGEDLDVESDDEEEEEDDGRVYEAGDDYIVVNFYHFVDIEDAHLEVARHSAFVEGRNIRGRIYINHQGINAQFSGPREDAMAYANWVKEDERFSPTYIQVSPSPRGHAFPRLRLRYKPSLVQVCESDNLPLTDPSARAVPLTPKQWRKKLEQRNEGDENRSDAEEKDDLKNVKKVLLLDVRNRYEWDVGHFQGAQRPEVECFKSTEFGLSDDKEVENDPLKGVDKENTDILMYCTGGIRCDVYSTILREKGFKNLYSLKGGVAKYLKEEGAAQWNGRLFVFDSRLAVPPAFYHGESEDTTNTSSSSTIARCLTCGSSVEPVHRNCANLDCNNLYLSCAACVTQFRGCCCNECMEAPRLRPILNPDETYQRWHNYRDPPPPPPRPPGFVSRRALKRRRRKERRREAELLKSSSSSDTVHGTAGSDSSYSEEGSNSLVQQL
ncbi:hypothetical protein KC19_2G091600 [Ceratodon purpureus]|uniref:Rhodanese domain-containing protein n=1 Tax=Ceratodon purpureus TaxID=3225 RepID=A0A8T0IUG9_CERPU|nr:hypothetical protein KC19_2G091600 [Ceratodon purpureus]